MVRHARAALVIAMGVAALFAGCRSLTTSVPEGRAMDDNRQGAIEYDRGELRSAESWFTSALQSSRSIDDPAGQAIALLNLARVDEQRWHYDRAQRRAEQAAQLVRDDPRLRGAALSRLAMIRSQRGAHDEAIADAREAIDLVGALDLRRRDAGLLAGDRATTLAYTLIYAGGDRCDEAQAVLDQVDAQYGKSRDDARTAAVAHLRGLLAVGRRDAPQAIAWLDQALTLDRDLGHPLDVAADLEAMGRATAVGSDPAAGAAWLSRALSVRESIDTPQRALATAQRLAELGQAGPELEGRMALLRAELGDGEVIPPQDPAACR